MFCVWGVRNKGCGLSVCEKGQIRESWLLWLQAKVGLTLASFTVNLPVSYDVSSLFSNPIKFLPMFCLLKSCLYWKDVPRYSWKAVSVDFYESRCLRPDPAVRTHSCLQHVWSVSHTDASRPQRCCYWYKRWAKFQPFVFKVFLRFSLCIYVSRTDHRSFVVLGCHSAVFSPSVSCVSLRAQCSKQSRPLIFLTVTRLSSQPFAPASIWMDEPSVGMWPIDE